MPLEIERKFLITSEEFRDQAFKSSHIIQGYLPTQPGTTVRVRTKGEKAFLTIKGKSMNGGLSRYEWEKEIPVVEAKELLLLCGDEYIDKIRHEVRIGEHIYEVDEFFGANQGLLLAEVELRSENEAFEKPDWLGKEVTGDPRYYNSRLLRNPYTKW